MSVPSSGAVSLSDIRGEFDAPAGTPLHDFVRGGRWVPDISANSGVPTSAPVSIDDLRGATAYVDLSVSAHDSSIAVPPSKGSYSSTPNSPTVSNGSPPYTYTLTHVSGASFGVTRPNDHSAVFSVTNVSYQPYPTQTGTYRWTVSDGTQTRHADFTVTAS